MTELATTRSVKAEDLTTAAERASLPFVTVIMPVRNEAHFVARSLRAVIDQDYPPDRFEVIVAEGMSEDGTRDVLEPLCASLPRVRIVDNRGLTAACGLNTATALAHGDVIIRVDGHCEVACDYVRKCVEHLRDDRVDGVGGPISTVGQTAVAHAIAVAMSSSFGVGDSPFRTVKDRNLLADTIPFPAYPRAVIEQLGPYDEELVRNQDDEYNYRLRAIGGRLLLASDVRSKYYSRSSFRSLWKQYFQYGYWKVRVMQKHPAQMRWRQFVPAAFVIALVVGCSSSMWFTFGWALLAAVLGVYLVTNVCASIIAAWRDRWVTRLLLPAVFASLHLAYGTGFLVGLIRFATRWREQPVQPHSPIWQRPRHAK